MAARSPLSRDELVRKCKELGPWFHQIDLGMGVRTRDVAPTIGVQERDHPRSRWEKIRDVLPPDMTGMRVLDIGCSDGFFAVEMARRHAQEIICVDGAQQCVTRLEWLKQHLQLPAIKPYYCSIESLPRVRVDEHGEPLPMDGLGRLYRRNALGWKVFVDASGRPLKVSERLKRRLGFATPATIAEVEQHDGKDLGRFDFVMMFALLYHLNDPLAGLETAARFSDVLYIETLAVEDETHSHLAYVPPRVGVRDRPKWFPTTRCLKDMLAWVGFKQITELAPATDHRPIYLARK